jgi:DUF4097 and DUF4098 domain-containing protein YvlB
VKKSFLFALVSLLSLGTAIASASGAREDDSFSYPGIDRLEIRAEFLNVEIRGGEGSSVSMRADLPEDSFFESRSFTVKHEVNGSGVRVWVERDGLFSHGSGTLFFSVPRDTLVTVDSASGDIRITGLSADELKARSASGRLIIRDIEAAVTAGSVSGSLEARRIRGDADLSTVSGPIEMNDVEGKIRAASISGSISGHRVLLTASSYFKTVSGEIRMDLVNALDGLRYDLSTVSGRLTVGSVRATRGLQMGNGDVMLTGETVSGSQTYR